MKPPPNAICLGGPCHGMLIRIDQDIGILRIPLPPPSARKSTATAGYRITRNRVHHPSCREPFVALSWADAPKEKSFADHSASGEHR
jgi:hypothetical protein